MSQLSVSIPTRVRQKYSPSSSPSQKSECCITLLSPSWRRNRDFGTLSILCWSMSASLVCYSIGPTMLQQAAQILLFSQQLYEHLNCLALLAFWVRWKRNPVPQVVLHKAGTLNTYSTLFSPSHPRKKSNKPMFFPSCTELCQLGCGATKDKMKLLSVCISMWLFSPMHLRCYNIFINFWNSPKVFWSISCYWIGVSMGDWWLKLLILSSYYHSH